MIVTDDNQLFMFGAGSFGECGFGDQKDIHVPTKLEIIKSGINKNSKHFNPTSDIEQIVDCSAGTKHSLALSGSGKLYAFGFGDNGQLGLKNTDNQRTPQWVGDFDGVRITGISAGNFHSIVQTDKGDLYSTGLNRDGQLGLGHNKSKTSFSYISCFLGVNVSKFMAGGNHSWFMIDEFMPFKPMAQAPPPLGQGLS